jgi:hypothetical protein
MGPVQNFRDTVKKRLVFDADFQADCLVDARMSNGNVLELLAMKYVLREKIQNHSIHLCA